MKKTLPDGPTWAIPATLSFIRDPYRVTAELRAQYGDLVTFPSLNGKLVLVMTPALAKPIFTTPGSHYGAWAVGTIGSVIGERALLATEGEVHRADRKLLSPPFHGRRMRAYAEQMRVQARKRFEAALLPGESVTMLEVTTDLTMDVILRSVFGVGDGPEFEEGRELLEKLVNLSPLLLFTKLSHTRLFGGYRKLLSLRARFRAWLNVRIQEARDRGGEGEDILALMLAARYDDGSGMRDEDIESQLITLLFAGHETTAISIAWAAHWLFRHPEALERLRTEIAELGADATAEDLARHPYLQGVCNETLRHNPIVTENLRKLLSPMELGGYTVPAGFGVGVSIAAIHADPEVYPEPAAFRPERFLERKYRPFEFLPFGGGHRRCIGAAFANYEMRLAVAELVMGWDLELLKPDERPVRRSVTMGPQYGVPVRVVGRRS